MAKPMEASANTGTEKSSSRNGAPAWAVQPFKEFLSDLEHQGQLLELSMKGIAALRGMPGIIQAIEKADGGQLEAGRELMRAKKEAELAQREIDKGFPLLHSFAVLSLWSSLEASMRLFIANWLQHAEGAINTEAIAKLKVRIGEYEALDPDERYFYIVDRLEQETSAPLRQGVTRFEILLEPFGLSGNVSAEVQRDLFELNHIRNALMHRAGRVDRRLLDACPWLILERGSPLQIDHTSMNRYWNSVGRYITNIVARIGTQFGADMREFLIEND